MRILLLGPDRGGLERFLRDSGDEVVRTEEPIDATFVQDRVIDFIVSYGYKHILRPPVLEAVKAQAINLHISLLPWNRGMYPNVWSYLEDTPKGVTIHMMDDGLDTGDILLQQEVEIPVDATLRTSYELLSAKIESLFKKNWGTLKAGEIASMPQNAGGTSHLGSELDAYRDLMGSGWDTPVADLVGRALSERG